MSDNFEPKMDRRQFLSGIGAGATLLAVHPGGISQGPKRTAAIDKVNFAGIGIGSQGGGDVDNIVNEGGNLVFEIICRFPVTQTDAKAACANYTDRVTLPLVGSHVRIVGTFVQDTFHGQWMEIHPVTSITVLP